MTTQPKACGVERGESAQDIYQWARRKLASGEGPARVAARLRGQGWAPELADYFVRQVDQATAPDRRRRAVFVALTGSAWLVLGSAGMIAGHKIGGTWSTQGPLLVGWGVVVCGLLRLAGGVANLIRSHGVGGAASARRRALRASRGRRKATIKKQPISPLRALDLQILGLSDDATPESASQAYKNLAKFWHPDLYQEASDIRERVEWRMKAINSAYSRIKGRWRD